MKSEPTNRLLAPNIYLFAYHLKEQNKKEQANSFWQECDALLSNFTTETLTKNIDVSTSDRFLLKDNKDRKKALEFAVSESPQIEGFAQPLQIKDGYGLFFNAGYDDTQEKLEEVDLEKVKELNPQQAILLPESEKYLGQTVIFTAYLASSNKQHDAAYLGEIANNCYRQLFADNNPPLYRSGELFGSSIFEYGNKTNNYQVLIWLFRDEKAHHQVNKCLNNLMDLLFYRAKIIKSFRDSRQIYQGLDGEYYKIEENLDKLQDKLDKHCDTSTSDYYLEDFKTQLKYFAQESLTYTRLLRKMEDLSQTIEINLFNYNETINLISEKLGMEKQELSFLQYFGTETAPHFRRQIKADLGYFEHGTDLISQAIASIRGIVEIDQAQRDRELIEVEKALEDQIQAVGVGIAAGAIVASTSGLMTQRWTLPSSDRPLLPPHPFILALIASVGCAWGAWWLAKKAIQKRRSGKS
jgi:hypothetical protein